MFISLCVFGQGHTQDIVYLHDGNVVKGEIIEEIAGESITMETPYRSILVFTFEEIEKVKRDQNTSPRFSNRVDLGLLSSGYGEGKELLWINSLWLNSFVSLGIGLGVRSYGLDIDDILIPVFVELNLESKGKKTMTFFTLDVGNSMTIYDGLKLLGPLAKTIVGVGLTADNGSKFRLGISFEIQTEIDEFVDIPNFDISYELGLGLNAGFSF